MVMTEMKRPVVRQRFPFLAVAFALVFLCFQFWQTPSFLFVNNIQQDVPSTLLDKFKLHAQFAALASYCTAFDPPGPCLRDWNVCVMNLSTPFPAISTPSHIQRAVMSPPLTLNSRIIRKFSSYVTREWRGGEGYVAYHPGTRSVVVAFKGSTVAADWMNDFKAWTAPFNPLNRPGNQTRLRVHSGIQDIYVHIRNQTLIAVELALQIFPRSPLVITGHSLGGALGFLLSAELRLLQLLNGTAMRDRAGVRLPYIPPTSHIELLTYGQPRIGNADFVSFYRQISRPRRAGLTPEERSLFESVVFGANSNDDVYRGLPKQVWWGWWETLKPLNKYRIVQRRDIVPFLPPTFLGFAHTESFYRIVYGDNFGDAKVVYCTDSPVDTIDGDVINDDSVIVHKKNTSNECKFDKLSPDGHSMYFWYLRNVSNVCARNR